jgi:hypothetical protein
MRQRNPRLQRPTLVKHHYLDEFVDHFILGPWIATEKPPDIVNCPLIIGDVSARVLKDKNATKWKFVEKSWQKCLAYLSDNGINTECSEYLFDSNFWAKVIKKKNRHLKNKRLNIMERVTHGVQHFNREFYNDTERELFINDISFLIANYKSILHVYGEISEYLDDLLKKEKAVFLTGWLKKIFGPTPKCDDILKKHICHLINQNTKKNCNKPKKIYKMIPYLLALTEVFPQKKCSFKEQHDVSRWKCHKTSCLKYRIISYERSEDYKNRMFNSDRGSPLKNGKSVCPTHYRAYQELLKQFVPRAFPLNWKLNVVQNGKNIEVGP